MASLYHNHLTVLTHATIANKRHLFYVLYQGQGRASLGSTMKSLAMGVKTVDLVDIKS